MPAAVTVSPTDVQVGDPVIITATGFLADTDLVVTVPEHGITTEIRSDKGGAASGQDLADKASTTITSSGVDVTANDTVTIDGVVYTFKASVTTTANEVKIGGTAAATLANLKKAINLTGVGGTDYGSLTVIHPTVGASTITATVLTLFAKTGGTGGNSLVITKSAVTLTVVSPFAGGAAATGTDPLVFTPQTPGPFTVNVTDGTSTASARVLVFTP